MPGGQYPDTQSPATDDILSDLDLIILLDKDGRQSSGSVYIFLERNTLMGNNRKLILYYGK